MRTSSQNNRPIEKKRGLFAFSEQFESLHFGSIFEAVFYEVGCFFDVAGCFTVVFIAW